MNDLTKKYFNGFPQKDISWFSDDYIKRIDYFVELMETHPSQLLIVDYVSSQLDLLQLFDMGINLKSFTSFGKKKYKNIVEILVRSVRTHELNMGKPFARKFFDYKKNYLTSKISSRFNPGLYKEFFDDVPHYVHNFKIHMQRPGISLSNQFFPTIVELAIQHYFKKEIREAENIFRTSIDIPKVGEGWISETELYYLVKEAFPERLIIQHARPKWLGRQHFDIYFPNEKIAIEYQGVQHSKPVDYFGGKEGYNRIVQNDKKKKEKVQLHDCTLIEVFPNYNFNEVKSKINECLKNEYPNGTADE